MSFLPNVDIKVSGNITTQNLVPGGTATAGSAVEIDTNSKGTINIQITGTHTGALSLQVTNDGANWITQSDNSTFLRMSDNALSASTPSGVNGIWQSEIAGHAKARITALGVVTGTAVVTVIATQGISQVSISESQVNLDSYASIVGDLNFGINTTLNSYVQALARDDEFWDTAIVGGGTCEWTQAAGGCTMTVTTTGDAVIRESKLAGQYLASAPQVWDITAVNMSPVAGVIKQYGYFSSSTTAPFDTSYDGFCLETDTQVYFKIYKGGATVFSAAQSTWDDALDGTGRSGITMDWTKFQALWCEFLYLGGTGADFGFLFGKQHAVKAHNFENANVNSATFVNSPHQKLRYSIRKISGAPSAASTIQICSKIGSKGQNNQRVKTRDHLYDVAGVYTFQPVTAGTEYAMMGVKLSVRLALAWLRNLKMTSTAADDFIVRIRRNPTVSGAGLTYAAVTHAPYVFGTAPTPAAPTITVSGGVLISQKVVSAAANEEFEFDAESLALSLGQSISGVFDELVISIVPITANLSLRGTISVGTNN